jgi:hypothetical protein
MLESPKTGRKKGLDNLVVKKGNETERRKSECVAMGDVKTLPRILKDSSEEETLPRKRRRRTSFEEAVNCFYLETRRTVLN